jgi:hypothetical protein
MIAFPVMRTLQGAMLPSEIPCSSKASKRAL